MSETPRSSTAQHYTDGCMTTDCDHETPSRESASSLIKARTILREWAINDGSTKLTMTARDMDTLRGAIALALDSAIRDRDFAWWQALVLNDCVAMEPEAAKKYILLLQAEAIREAEERTRKLAASRADGGVTDPDEFPTDSWKHGYARGRKDAVKAILEGA